MIYCLTSLDTEGNTLYKIGFTDNLKERIKHYYVHNPSCKLVKVMEGNMTDERCIHTYLHLKGLCKYRQEWYTKDGSIDKILSEPIEEVKQYLWNNREVVFTKKSLKNNDWYNLYKQLERKNKKTKRS